MRASSVVGSSSVIELNGYEVADAVDLAAFVAAWRAARTAGPPPVGLLYRELARQRPDWNAQIQAEITSPNPFTFVDYSVFRSAADHADARAGGGGAPTMLPGDPKVTTGVFTIAARFARAEAPGEPDTVLYNFFQVQGGETVEEAFASRWPERAQYQAQQHGFYSAVLHRKALPGQVLTAFNRAEWRDPGHYADTLAGFERNFPRAERSAGGVAPGPGGPPVRSFLGLFQIVDTLALA